MRALFALTLIAGCVAPDAASFDPTALDAELGDAAFKEDAITNATRIRGFIRRGDSVTDALDAPGRFLGYLFRAGAGMRATVTARKPEGSPVALLYGPQGASLNWPERVAYGLPETLDGDEVTLDVEIPADGYYMAVVGDVLSLPGDVRVTLLLDATRAPTPEASGCTPASCAEQGLDCGAVDDGCGRTLHCGECGAGQTCGGDEAPNVCGAPPVDVITMRTRVTGDRALFDARAARASATTECTAWLASVRSRVPALTSESCGEATNVERAANWYRYVLEPTATVAVPLPPGETRRHAPSTLDAVGGDPVWLDAKKALRSYNQACFEALDRHRGALAVGCGIPTDSQRSPDWFRYVGAPEVHRALSPLELGLTRLPIDADVAQIVGEANAALGGAPVSVSFYAWDAEARPTVARALEVLTERVPGLAGAELAGAVGSLRLLPALRDHRLESSDTPRDAGLLGALARLAGSGAEPRVGELTGRGGELVFVLLFDDTRHLALVSLTR